MVWPCVVGAAVTLAACSLESPDPVPSPSPVASPGVEELVGVWQSQSTDDAVLTIEADGTFELAGLCGLAGQWAMNSDGQVVVSVDLIPGIGGCATTFTLDRADISSILLLVSGELQLVDDAGHTDTFSKV